MPEIRIDPLTGLRAVIADAGAQPAGAIPPVPAAFDGPGAVLHPDAADPPPSANPDLFWSGAARGAQETISHSGEPGSRLAELEPAALAATLEHWRERMRVHSDASCLHLWLDEGAAGAPGEAHLAALSFVPAAIARERERFGAYATRTMGGNLIGDLLQQEVRARDRLVSVGAEAVLLSPYAARVPYQLMIVPRAVRARFEDDGPLGAATLHDALARLVRRLGADVGLHVWLRTAPGGAEHFCWRIDILPRLSEPDGLDLGAGLAVNPVAPERAAAELRDA